MRSARSAVAAGSMLIALAACTPAPQAPGEALTLPFVENDFSAAVARAREAKLPLFVEVWAPW